MIDKDWPVAINESCLIGHRKAPSVGMISQGPGDRALYCDRYERCLNFAAVNDWEGFNCENCGYEKKGRVNFCFHEFEGPDPEDEDNLIFCSEPQMDLLLGPANNQEDFLITLIEARLEDDLKTNG